MSARFDYAETLLFQLKALGLPLPEREYQPFTDRKFRLDCAWPARKLFAECDGGEHLRAVARRHGGATDCLRWNLLTLAGWTGFRFVGSQVTSGYAIEILTAVLTEGSTEGSHAEKTQTGGVSLSPTGATRADVRDAPRARRPVSRRAR